MRHKLTAAAVLLLAATSCSSVRQSYYLPANISRLEPGMTATQVRKQLGDPHIKNFEGKEESWGYVTEIDDVKMVTWLHFRDKTLQSSKTTPVPNHPQQQ